MQNGKFAKATDIEVASNKLVQALAITGLDKSGTTGWKVGTAITETKIADITGGTTTGYALVGTPSFGGLTFTCKNNAVYVSGTPNAVTSANNAFSLEVKDSSNKTATTNTVKLPAIAQGENPISVTPNSANVKEGATTSDFTISNAKGTVTVTSGDTSKYTVSYNNTTKKFTITGVAETTGAINLSIADAGDTNWKAKTITVPVTVTAASAPTITVTNYTHTYDGTNKTATVTAKNPDGTDIAAGNISVTYGGAANQKNANESGYAIVVTIGGKTYPQTEKLIINKKPLTITYGNAEIGNKLDGVTATIASGVVSGETVTLGALDWTDSDGGALTAASAELEGGKTYKLKDSVISATAPALAANYTIGNHLTVEEPIVLTGLTVTYKAGAHGKLEGKLTESIKSGKSPVAIPKTVADKGYAFVAWSADGGKTFTDPATYVVKKSVTFTAMFGHKTYVEGYPDGSFKPNGHITRAEAARMVCNLEEAFNPKGLYDVTAYGDVVLNDWFASAVGYGTEHKLVTGYPDGNYKPQGSITRGEFTALVARYMGVAEVAGESSMSDVKGHWAAGYINAMVQKGLIDGYPNGTFRPEQAITRAEAVRLMNGALARRVAAEKVFDAVKYANPYSDVAADNFFLKDILEASMKHVMEDVH